MSCFRARKAIITEIRQFLPPIWDEMHGKFHFCYKFENKSTHIDCAVILMPNAEHIGRQNREMDYPISSSNI